MNRREFLKVAGAAGTLPLFNIGCAGFGRSRLAQLSDGANGIGGDRPSRMLVK